MISTSDVRTRCVLRTRCTGSAAGISSGLAILAGAVALWLTATGPLFATGINYGSFSGTTVDFKGVMEDSNTGDTLPLFGPPTTVGPVTPGFPAVPCVLCGIPGDSLSFNPVGFNANTSGANGIDMTDGQLKFVVDAKGNTVISNILITEAGDTTLGGFGTDLTTTSVYASVFVDISEVDNIGVPSVKKTLLMPFVATPVKANPQNQFRLGTDGGGGPVAFWTWQGTLPINLNQMLTDAGVKYNGGTTIVTINLDNVLIATSQLGTQSTIAKKQGGIIIKINIPEPTSVVLAVIGCLGLGMMARRFHAS